jgi:glycosyltransferase involved in cell wall biosynthesis
MSQPPRTLSIIMPALDEEYNLQAALDDVIGAASEQLEDHEIILVDDGSRDRTWDIITRNRIVNSKVRAIQHPRAHGLGASFREARSIARMEYTVMVHGDHAFDRETLSCFFSYVGYADVLAGLIQNPESRTPFRRMVSRAYTSLLNLLFAVRMPYFNGLQVHCTRWLARTEIRSIGFGFMAELLLKAYGEGQSVLFIPTRHNERPKGGATKIFKPRNLLSIFESIYYLKTRRRKGRHLFKEC